MTQLDLPLASRRQAPRLGRVVHRRISGLAVQRRLRRAALRCTACGGSLLHGGGYLDGPPWVSCPWCESGTEVTGTPLCRRAA